MISKNKKIVSISMTPERYKALKTIAVQNDLQLSDLLVAAGTITNIKEIKKHIDSAGATVK